MSDSVRLLTLTVQLSQAYSYLAMCVVASLARPYNASDIHPARNGRVVGFDTVFCRFLIGLYTTYRELGRTE